jgi:hypothetical protein
MRGSILALIGFAVSMVAVVRNPGGVEIFCAIWCAFFLGAALAIDFVRWQLR